MDDLNITMEEYIMLEEEKAQKPIAFNDEVSSEKTLSCEPTISSLNDEFDFRISFDDSADEDYTWVGLCKRLGDLKEEVQGLHRKSTLRGLVERSVTDQGRFSTWMISCMAQLMEASGQAYQAFNGTF
ncbi:hypothetical protein Tco_0843281 [Tanacetum coccineum]|uniref:Uncharacterized protein n=1 Tax=Tanacetum coccineum TaxID=301880 RepID=A0ABQ5B601_9ASTR